MNPLIILRITINQLSTSLIHYKFIIGAKNLLCFHYFFCDCIMNPLWFSRNSISITRINFRSIINLANRLLINYLSFFSVNPLFLLEIHCEYWFRLRDVSDSDTYSIHKLFRVVRRRNKSFSTLRDDYISER